MKFKSQKIKQKKYISEDTRQVRNLIIITLIIIILAGGLYFLTNTILAKKEASSTTTTTASIDYDTCIIGQIFNRPYSEYYVFIYDSTSDDASQFDTLLSDYKAKDDAIKIYSVDLNSKFNSGFVSDTANTKPTKVSEVAIKGSALILIKDGKVSKYYQTTADYEEVLN